VISVAVACVTNASTRCTEDVRAVSRQFWTPLRVAAARPTLRRAPRASCPRRWCRSRKVLLGAAPGTYLSFSGVEQRRTSSMPRTRWLVG